MKANHMQRLEDQGVEEAGEMNKLRKHPRTKKYNFLSNNKNYKGVAKYSVTNLKERTQATIGRCFSIQGRLVTKKVLTIPVTSNLRIYTYHIES